MNFIGGFSIIEEVIVYGKIPRNSIAIPTITDWCCIVQFDLLHKRWNFTESFFHDCSEGSNKKIFTKDVYSYFKEVDEVKGDMERWKGNFEYIKALYDSKANRSDF